MNSDSTPAVQTTADTEAIARKLDILDRLASGTPYRQISKDCGISIGALTKIAQEQAQLEREGFRKLMLLKSLPMLEHWEEAAKSGARTGKHGPAKDWLLHAGAIEPLAQDESGGAKVAVIIGMPGQPVGLPDVQVLTGQRVTRDTDE